MGISRTIRGATFTLGGIDVENGTFIVKVAGTRTSKMISFIGDVIDPMADIETFSRVAGQESITFVVSDEIAHDEDPKTAITGCFWTLMDCINEYVTRDPRLTPLPARSRPAPSRRRRPRRAARRGGG